MRKISGSLACMAAIAQILLLLSALILVAGCEKNAPAPQPLPADIVTAWENAGAQSGWISPQGN
jgi:hypothetical protein